MSIEEQIAALDFSIELFYWLSENPSKSKEDHPSLDVTQWFQYCPLCDLVKYPTNELDTQGNYIINTRCSDCVMWGHWPLMNTQYQIVSVTGDRCISFHLSTKREGLQCIKGAFRIWEDTNVEDFETSTRREGDPTPKQMYEAVSIRVHVAIVDALIKRRASLLAASL